VGSRAAAVTLRAGQTPVILCSSEVKSRRGRTVEALAGFIGTGAVVALAWLGAARGTRGRAPGVLWRGQGASNTWRCVSALVQTFAEITNV
jgi:hypothetical protein